MKENEFYCENGNTGMKKCAIIGCGFVGATTAYTIMQSRLFNEMVLIDIDKKKADGEAMDLTQALPFVSPMNIYAGEYSDLSDAGIIIITAGANQRPGQTRIDLVKTNVRIFESIVDQIKKYNSTAILLVVSNPVDILTYVTLKLSGFPKERVIGSGTVLDTARLKQLVGSHLGVDARNVHSFIIGEHGDSEVAIWSSANISGIDLNEFCDTTCNDCSINTLHSLHDQVKNSAYRIIEAKGVTNYAIAEAVRRIVSAIVRDEDTVMPVSVLANGHYGMNDLCIGLPCIVGAGGIHRILDIPLDENETLMLMKSCDALKEIINSVSIEALV